MLFEVYPKGKKWAVRHILTQNDILGPGGPFETKKQAEIYADLFEKSPFIWHFTDPKHLTVLNDRDTVEDFAIEARHKALGVK